MAKLYILKFDNDNIVVSSSTRPKRKATVFDIFNLPKSKQGGNATKYRKMHKVVHTYYQTTNKEKIKEFI